MSKGSDYLITANPKLSAITDIYVICFFLVVNDRHHLCGCRAQENIDTVPKHRSYDVAIYTRQVESVGFLPSGCLPFSSGGGFTEVSEHLKGFGSHI